MRKIAVWVGLVCLVCLPARADQLETRAFYDLSDGWDTDEVVWTTSTPGQSLVSIVNRGGEVFAGAAATMGSGGMTGAVQAEGLFFDGSDTNIVRAVDTLTLDVAAAGVYSFAFAIPEIKLEIQNWQSTSPGLPTARYEVRIKVNGVNRWGSAAVLRGGYPLPILDRAGVLLNATHYFLPGDLVAGYDFDPYATSIDLGSLQAGDIVTYMLWAEVTGAGREAGGYAAIGDPNNLSGSFASGKLVGGGGQPIPEPGSALLLVLGIGVILWFKRRRS